MKQGKRPTREQRKFLISHGYDPTVWLVAKDTPTEMVIVAYHDNTYWESISKTEGGKNGWRASS